jgi:hypothetical protein
VPDGIALEPGATVDLDPGQKVQFAEPADVGGNYEAFQYRGNLQVSAGAGVPYAEMTGDLRQASYGSQRAGMLKFRREIGATQNHAMIFQFCRPVWQRWLSDAVLAGAVPIAPSVYTASERTGARQIHPAEMGLDRPAQGSAGRAAGGAGRLQAARRRHRGARQRSRGNRRAASPPTAREKALGLDFAEGQFAAAQIKGVPETCPPSQEAPQNGA